MPPHQPAGPALPQPPTTATDPVTAGLTDPATGETVRALADRLLGELGDRRGRRSAYEQDWTVEQVAAKFDLSHDATRRLLHHHVTLGLIPSPR